MNIKSTRGAYGGFVINKISPIQNCSITSGLANIAGQDVTDIIITCDNLDLIYEDGFEWLSIFINEPTSLFD